MGHGESVPFHFFLIGHAEGVIHEDHIGPFFCQGPQPRPPEDRLGHEEGKRRDRQDPQEKKEKLLQVLGAGDHPLRLKEEMNRREASQGGSALGQPMDEDGKDRRGQAK